MIFIHGFKLITALIFVFTIQISHAASPTSEMLYFIGLKNNEWLLLYKQLGDTNFKEIKTESEPRELYFSAKDRSIFYIDAEYKLRQLTLSENQSQDEKVLFTPSENDLYAQPYWDQKKKNLYLVKMPHGKSSEADIVAWKEGRMIPVIRQISSQFEPFIDQQNRLFYGHVHCSLACGRIIQEIWQRNLITGEADQVSLLGSISRQAVADSEGEWVYFSSNKQGTYHIWKQKLNNTNASNVIKAEQISTGNVTDTDPAISKNKGLYFIRHQQGKASLIHLNKEGVIKSVNLPDGVSEIRNLRINP